MAQLYRVHYGYFNNKGQLQSDEKVQDVLAADGQEATIKAVFSSNSLNTRGGLTMQIISIQNSGNVAAPAGFIQ